MFKPRAVLSSAKLIAVCTLLSRVTGLVRDMQLAYLFGLQYVQDAFLYAFQIPNLFRRLFGEGALAAVFVPVFTRTLEVEGRAAAWKLLARTTALLATTLVLVIVLIECVLLVLWLSARSGDPEQLASRELVLGLTALMLPFMLTVCLLALFSSILNCVGSFVPAALAPVVLNLVMIAGLALAPSLGGPQPERRVWFAAISVLVAGAAQVLFVLPALRAAGIPLGWSLTLSDPQVRRMMALMGPVLLGQGALLIGTFLDSQVCLMLTQTSTSGPTANWFGWQFAYPLHAGALSAVSTAQRLYQFPLGVLVISLGTAALPEFSRLAVREEWGEWSRQTRVLLRLAIFEGLLAGAMMIVLAEPIVRLLFERGKFGPQDSVRAGFVLAWYGPAMWAFCAQQIVQRAFYSIGEVRTPLWIAAAMIPLNLALSVLLIWQQGIHEAGFAISSTVTSSLAVIVGLVLLKRRVARPLWDRAMSLGVLRMLLAAAVAAGVIHWLHGRGLSLLQAAGASSLIGRILEVAVGLGVGGTVYLLVSAGLGLPEWRVLIGGRTVRKSAAE